MSTETETVNVAETVLPTDPKKTRICRICNEIKPLDNYYHSRKGYKASYCKKCTCEYHRKYKKDNVVKFSKTFVCDCGGRFNSEHKTQHLKTKRHKNFIGHDGQPPVIMKSIICDCGGRYLKQNKSKHKKSKIHQKYINSLNSDN